MATVKHIQDKNGNILYPVTVEDAVKDSENIILSNKLAAINTQIASKQDNISDLSTIRDNAFLGSTAYQKPSTGIPTTDLAGDVRAVVVNSVLLGEVIATVTD